MVTVSDVSKRIYTIRDCQVMFDTDLAEIYDVETRIIKRAVRRNIERFPTDFFFEPTQDELANLRSQIGISSSSGVLDAHPKPILRSQFGISSFERTSKAHGGSRYSPFVFSEQGIAMLSTALNTERAVQLSITIMRAFVQFRKQSATASSDIHSGRLESLERKFDGFAQELSQRMDRIEVKSQRRISLTKVSPENSRVETIQKIVAKRFGLTVGDLKSASRTKEIVFPRQVAVYLVRKHLCLSFKEIGLHFGGRDHSSVLHAYQKMLTLFAEAA